MSDSSQPAAWLYSRNGKTFGPLTEQELRRLVVERRIGPQDLVCRDGTDRWVAAGTIGSLFPNARAGAANVETVVVQPSGADRPAEADREDTAWRSRGGWFLVANLAACGIVGLVKPPPAHIAAYEDAMKDVRGITTDLQKSLERSTRRIVEDMERTRQDIERDTSGRAEDAR